jgi:two-component system sensor histidine kinase UhpB
MSYSTGVLLIVIGLQAAAIVGLLIQKSRHARAERALRESEGRLQLMLDRAPGMVWTARPDTTLDYVNRFCAEFTGLPIEKLLDEGWLDAVHTDDRDPAAAIYVPAVEARRPFIVEYRMRRADGAYRWVLATGVPMYGPGGGFSGYVGIDIDITERKIAEERIRESRAALEVSHREIQHLAGRLIEAQDAERARIARDLHDDVSQQLAGLSIALSSLKHRMEASQVGEELKADLRALHQRTATLAQNVRHLSHDLHPTVLRHGGLVAALTSYCAELQRSHGPVLACNAEGDFASLHAEVALCLYRIAQEALRNVVAHSGATRAEVRLLRSGAHAEMTIADDGHGFDVAHSLEQGRGLGLVSIRERVRLASGTVSFESEGTKGTRVHVQVPANALANADAGSGIAGEQREVNLS